MISKDEFIKNQKWKLLPPQRQVEELYMAHISCLAYNYYVDKNGKKNGKKLYTINDRKVMFVFDFTSSETEFMDFIYV